MATVSAFSPTIDLTGEVGPWVEAAPEGNGEPEAHPEGNGEPETNPEGNGEPEGWPEAGPEWDKAKKEWREAWPVHVYLFALIFFVISIIAIYIAVGVIVSFHGGRRGRSSSGERLSPGAHRSGMTTVALTLMVLSFSLSRCLFLLVDPYFSEALVPFIFARLIWSFGIPGFTASFSILLLILLDTTNLTLEPPKFQNLSTVAIIWLVQMVVVLVTDILVFNVQADARPLLVMCQMLFVVYGAVVSVGYAWVWVKMRANLRPGFFQSKLRRLVVMTLLSSVVALSVAILNLYTAFSEFGPYADVDFVRPWHFWTMQTLSRIMEVMACILVLMLFFRSDKAGTTQCMGERCSALFCHRRGGFRVHPEGDGEKGCFTVSTSVVPTVPGVKWRQIEQPDVTK